MTNAYDLIVVGAGMVGSAIACGLARYPLRIAIIDTHMPPPYEEDVVPHIRVSALSLSSENLLQHLGAWPYLTAKRLCPYRQLSVNEMPAKKGLAARLPDISQWANTQFNAEDIGQTHLGHIAENDLIQLSLHEAMAKHENIDLYCPAEIQSMALNETQKQITLKDGQCLSAPLVVGADGARSQVRESAAIGQHREQYEQHAMVMTVSYRGTQQDKTWQSFTEHGPLAFLPLSDSGEQHYASLVWYDFSDSIDELMALDSDSLRRHVQQSYPSELPPIIQIESKGRFPLFKSHAHQYARPGVVLAGDAAHTINPLAGQGVNLGFMDAAVLIEQIGQAMVHGEDYASLKVLSQYEKKRRLANQSMMSAMDIFYHGFGNKHLPVRVARNLGLGLANRVGFAKNQVMNFATGLSGDLPKLAKPV